MCKPSAITEASAASRQKRVAPAQKSEQGIQPPGAMRPPARPGSCVLDEGYGRYRPCSGGTGGAGACSRTREEGPRGA